MTLTEREFWTVIHGMVLGATFLLAFSGGLAGLWSLRPASVGCSLGGPLEDLLSMDLKKQEGCLRDCRFSKGFSSVAK